MSCGVYTVGWWCRTGLYIVAKKIKTQYIDSGYLLKLF